MVMVKAFGYRNGGLEISKLLEHHNVDYLGVAFDEGISLKNGGIHLPIMVLNRRILVLQQLSSTN
jgi:alanine racemase